MGADLRVAPQRVHASMESGADLDPKRLDLVGNGAGAGHTARRAIEGGKDAIADRFDSF